ncbi:Serine/threonine-protein phosphatase [Spironucleus salmonicida]|nr:Serine/threonine-protein phosphatase [Spironucleus salmonicida]
MNIDALNRLMNNQGSPQVSKQELERRKRMYFASNKPGPGVPKKEQEFFQNLVNDTFVSNLFTDFQALMTVTDQTPTFILKPLFESSLVLRTLQAAQKLFQTLLNVEKVTVPGISQSEYATLVQKHHKNQEIQLLGPNKLPPQTNHKLILAGDTHGTFESLITIFTHNPLNKDTYYVFNGDYVDRGSFSVEILTFLLILRLAGYNIFMTRGNHEIESVCENYSYKLELEKKYPLEHAELFEASLLFFKQIPIGVIINDSWLVIHGGLSAWENFDIEVLKKLNRCRDPESDQSKDLSHFDPLNDVLWADPTDEIPNVRFNDVRGASVQFGVNYTKKFLQKSKLQHIVRSHTCVEAGYEEMHEGQVFTLFSVPNYNGNNLGAYMVFYGIYDENKEVSQIIKGIYGENATAKDVYLQNSTAPKVFIRQFINSDNSRIVNQPLIQEMSQNMMQRQIQQMMMMYGGGM